MKVRRDRPAPTVGLTASGATVTEAWCPRAGTEPVGAGNRRLTRPARVSRDDGAGARDGVTARRTHRLSPPGAGRGKRRRTAPSRRAGGRVGREH